MVSEPSIFSAPRYSFKKSLILLTRVSALRSISRRQRNRKVLHLLDLSVLCLGLVNRLAKFSDRCLERLRLRRTERGSL